MSTHTIILALVGCPVKRAGLLQVRSLDKVNCVILLMYNCVTKFIISIQLIILTFSNFDHRWVREILLTNLYLCNTVLRRK